MITKDDYCIHVCKAKCCYHWKDNIKCCKLDQHCRCSIYEQRFGAGSKEEQVISFYHSKEKDPETGGHKVKPFVCSRISKLLATKQLPDWVEAQCCYAHPELAENYDSNNLPKNRDYETYY